MKSKHGYFVISLDFELFWGIRDKYSFEEYGENVLGVWNVIPKLLDTFKEYNIHATFATVGAMFAKDKEDLLKYLPEEKPNYDDENLSPYLSYIDESNNYNPNYYYGEKLIKLIMQYDGHEIGTHTFTHYYCLEPGNNKTSFQADLKSAIDIAKSKNINITSFVFPRHQLNKEYIDLFKDFGIKNYRGTEKMWYHSPSQGDKEGVIKRGFRFADYFIKIGSNHLQDINEINHNGLNRIRASRWLRPYDDRKILQRLKIRRIKQQMKAAVKQNKIFHLWWHPHEFGVNTEENFKMLIEILDYYKYLNNNYNMKNYNFKELIDYKESHEN